MPANWHLKKEVTLGIIWSVLGGLAIGLVFVAKLWADVEANKKAVEIASTALVGIQDRNRQVELDVSAIKADMANIKDDTKEIKRILHDLSRRD